MGRTVDFTNTIVVMTIEHRQPLRSQEMTGKEGGSEQEVRDAVNGSRSQALRKEFLPEFLNRDG